jgi:hypothetical protein
MISFITMIQFSSKSTEFKSQYTFDSSQFNLAFKSEFEISSIHINYLFYNSLSFAKVGLYLTI